MKQVFAGCILLFFLAGAAAGQTTAFTYQGSLSVGGVPANGNFDFQFSLFGAATGGSPVTLSTAVNNVAVADGIFSVLVNFGNAFPGAERWLEIRVRPASQGSFTTLAPRQIILSSPYSVKSINSELLGGAPASQYVLTSDSRLADARNPLPNSASYIQNRTSTQASSNFNISGNGTIGGSLTVAEGSAFQKSLGIGTTLSVAEAASIGGGLNVGGTLTVTSPATVNGTVNTNSHFNIGGNFALGRSRLDLFNTDVTPRGFTFEVLNNPEYLIVKNDLGSTLMTIAPDGKVGIGDNNPLIATLEVGGTLAVSNLGGVDGEHLCRVGSLIRACSAARASNVVSVSKERIDRLDATIRTQQIQIENQRNELNELKQIVCSIVHEAAQCRPKK